MINDFKEKIYEVVRIMIPTWKPVKTRVYIGEEKFLFAEMLFQPVNINRLSQSIEIHEQTYKSIKKFDEDIHKDLFYNVILCEGSSLFSWRR